MNLADHLDLLMFAAAILALLSGYPVAFTLGGIALAFALIGMGLGVFDPAILNAAPGRIYGVMTNQVLVAVPLFVFMGVMLEKSRVAEELLGAMGRLFGRAPGGLGLSVVIVGALLAASTGIVGATVVTMGLLALPTMLKAGYSPKLASGVITASGTLGQIIPPSIVLVLLGDVMGNAYQKSQRDQGVFAPDTVSVSDLFAGALLPGLLLVALYAAWVMGSALLRPAAAPPLKAEDAKAESRSDLLHALFPPLALMIAVLGSIIAGVATPTEAAAIGAVGATFLAGLRQGETAPGGTLAKRLTWAGFAAGAGVVALASALDLRVGREAVSGAEQAGMWAAGALCAVTAIGFAAALYRLWASRCVHEVSRDTARISSMVFVILIGATIFSLVFRGLGGDELVAHLLDSASGGLLSALQGALGLAGQSELGARLASGEGAQAAAGVLVVMAVMFALGFFLDFIEITFVVVPLVAPHLLALGIDPVWLGVMMAVNLQTSFLTPPFGFALFYLRGVAPASVSTNHIYAGALPFVGLQIVALVLVALFPALATALPALAGR